jgi:hypothetical protein
MATLVTFPVLTDHVWLVSPGWTVQWVTQVDGWHRHTACPAPQTVLLLRSDWPRAQGRRSVTYLLMPSLPTCWQKALKSPSPN